MYKKTTIIEESDLNPWVEKASRGVFDNIPNENTPLAINSRLTNRHYYTMYTIYMREYMNTVYNKWPTAGIKNTISTHTSTNYIKSLSPWVTTPTIPTATVETLIMSMSAMTNDMCNVIDSALANSNKDAAIAASKKSIGVFATNLFGLIYLLPVDRVTAIWESYLYFVIAQAENRVAGEWALDSEKYYNGVVILASDYAGDSTPFADAMTNAFVQWQPWRFSS